MFEKIFQLVYKFPKSAFFIAVLLAYFGVRAGHELPVSLSLTDLLPSDRVSVKEMLNVTKDVGGVGYLNILIGPTDNPSQYLKPVADAIEGLPNINYMFYETEKHQLKDKVLYVLPDEEFSELNKHVKTIFRKGKSSMIDLGLSDEEIEKERLAEADDFFNKLKKESKTTKYFLSKDGKYTMLLIKPSFDSVNLSKSRNLVRMVQYVMDTNFKGQFPYTLTGRYVDKVRDKAKFESDIALTGTISLVGIGIVLIIGLGSLRAVAMTLLGITLAMGWTVGIAKVLVGQVNILTGFLLAILGGLGAEYGIHLIRTFYKYLASGLSKEDAIQKSYLHMGRALFSAAITSASAFLILILSDFRGFSELGIIAGLGIISIYLVYMMIFPLLAKLLPPKPMFKKVLELFGFFPFSQKWGFGLLIMLPLLLWGIFNSEFEYNFKRMHDLSKETTRLKDITDELFGKSLTPSAILAPDQDTAIQLADWLKVEDDGKELTSILTFNNILPQDMEGRQRKIEKLGKLLDGVSDQELKEKTSLEAKTIHQWLETPPYQKSELPLNLQSAFGKSDNIVLLYPKSGLGTADELYRFADLLTKAKEEFPTIQIGSDTLVFVEIIQHIVDDGRVVMLLFLIGAFLVFWLDFRKVSDALWLELQLVSGIALLVALMGIFQIKFTILNVAMIPAVLAAGVDMGVHVRHQEITAQKSSLFSAKFIAQAVQLSALTTIMGFGSLFFSEASMLQGIAWISVLGQISMYIICMVAFPLFKDWLRLRKQGTL